MAEKSPTSVFAVVEWLMRHIIRIAIAKTPLKFFSARKIESERIELRRSNSRDGLFVGSFDHGVPTRVVGVVAALS